ncbi:MAG TPA: hypothetical protein VGD59_10035 [Acidisarcina sp.]
MLVASGVLASLAPQLHGQSLAVYNSAQPLSDGDTVYIESTFGSGSTDPTTFYTPSMPALGVAYDQKGGPCGQIDYTINISYDGYHFHESNFNPQTHKLELFPTSTDFDETEMPTISGTVNCDQQIHPVQWNDSLQFHYGGDLVIQWHLDADASVNGTFGLTLYGTNPSNQDFDDGMSYLASQSVPDLPINWLERLFSLESAANGWSKHLPAGQYHQFNAVDTGANVNSGNPNDTCGCPEGVGVGQIDEHTRNNSNGHLVPAQIGPDMFWDWFANVGEGLSNHLAPFENSGISHWNTDTNLAAANGLPNVPPQNVTNLPSGCALYDTNHAQWAYEMDGYNSGHNARFTKVSRNSTTGVWSWSVAHTYFRDLCNRTAY